MRSRTPVTLIIGSDGLVGRALMMHLQQTGERVIGTTRRHALVDQTHLYLDLADEGTTWRCPWPVSVAVICAGVTKLEACKRDPVAASRVNILGICALAERLVRHGTFVIYLSTNQVFDGSTPYRKPDEPFSPITEYGRQKAEAERQLSRWADAISIVRFTKILEPKPPLFSAWATSLRKGESIEPFSDMRMAPISLGCAVAVLRLVADKRLTGVLQVSGDTDISYEDAARHGATLLQADPRLIQPITSAQSDCFSEPVASHTTLNVDRLKSALGIIPADVWSTIEGAFLSLLHAQDEAALGAPIR